jgi:predicted transcriptional regulator
MGILMRNDLVKGIAGGGRLALVKSAMRQNCTLVEPFEPFRTAFDKICQGERFALPVLDGGRLVGLVALENFGELVMVSEAASQFQNRG